MGRPKKRTQRYAIREDRMEIMKKHPELFHKYIKPFDINTFVENLQKSTIPDISPELKKYLEVATVTGLPLDIIIGFTIGKEIDPFQLKLNENQIKILHPYFNNLLVNPINFEQFKELLNGETYNTLYRVKNTRALSALFKALCNCGYICKEWQSLFDKFHLFSSKKGKPINSLDLAKSISSSENLGGTRSEDPIFKEIITKLKKEVEYE